MLILLKMSLMRVFVVFSVTYLYICQVRPQFAQNSLCSQLYRGTCRVVCLGSERRFPVPDSVLFCRGGSCCKSDLTAGIWAAWTSWSTCAASCGDGVRSRSRACQFGQCLGESSQTGQCRRPGCLLLPPTTSSKPTSATTVTTTSPSSATSTTTSLETSPTSLTTSTSPDTSETTVPSTSQTIPSTTAPTTLTTETPATTSTSPDTSETTVTSTPPTTPSAPPSPPPPTATTTTTTIPVVRRRCGSVGNPGTVPGTDCSGSSWSVSLEIVNVDGDVSSRIPVCSGVLLSMTEILATAVCAEGLKRTLDEPRLQAFAVAGSVTCGTQARTITNVTLFDNTAEISDIKGDLAILNVGDGFKPDACASSACLPSNNDVFNRGDICRLTGWRRETPSVSPVSQQQVYVTLLPTQTCQNIYGSLDPRNIHSDTVCTDSENANFARCEDANGWMLVCDNSDGIATLVGLATPGTDCTTTRPSVFQAVRMHLDWIGKNVPSEDVVQGL